MGVFFHFLPLSRKLSGEMEKGKNIFQKNCPTPYEVQSYCKKQKGSGHAADIASILGDNSLHLHWLYHNVYTDLLKKDIRDARSAYLVNHGKEAVDNAIRKDNTKRKKKTLARIHGEGRFSGDLKRWFDKYKRSYLTDDFGNLSSNLPMFEFIDEILSGGGHEYTHSLSRVKKAAERLSRLDLEAQQQLFFERLDLCSYRLDAWKQGLVIERLKKHRAKPENHEASTWTLTSKKVGYRIHRNHPLGHEIPD